MRISTKGRYALRALLEMAQYPTDKPILLSRVAQQQEIPERYLIQIFGSLRRAGILVSLRGAKGGFILAKPLDEITLADIVEAAEGPIELVPCLKLKSKECQRSPLCRAKQVWEGLNANLKRLLQQVTLKQILQADAETNLWGEVGYQI